MRLGLGAFGIAIVVAVLLGAASASTVLAEREGRQLAQHPVTAPVDGVAPTYLGMVFTSYRGSGIQGTLVRHEDASSPVPPGVARQLDAGEVVVSPALAELLSSPEGELLRPRFADYRIVGMLGKPGLVEPDDLRFVAGSGAIEAATKTVGGQVLTDPAYRAYGFDGDIQRHPLPVELLALVALATAALLIPLLIFIVSSARIAGAERDRRLAALRLVGGDAAQVRRIAAGEALLPAAAGLVAGGALFLAVRPLADHIQLFGVGVFADDIAPSWWLVVLIVSGVPMLSVGATLFAMRRTVIEPLGVARQGKPARRRPWWRLRCRGRCGGAIRRRFLRWCSFSHFALRLVSSVLPWSLARSA
ncbi:MAG: FtsX-like permease family protein [Actinophytocola sp.]|nr:FtsX-like permease family protein [Actinophytocola sp.]